MDEFEFTAVVLDAARFAAEAHDGQKRKGTGAPYLLHPLRVARRVASYELPDRDTHRAMVIAAVLHDVIEDTDIEGSEIEERFGAKVLSFVSHLTHDKTGTRAERHERMKQDIASMPLESRLIKLADRLDNVSEMGCMSPEFIERYCRETRGILDVLKGTHPQMEQAIEETLCRFNP